MARGERGHVVMAKDSVWKRNKLSVCTADDTASKYMRQSDLEAVTYAPFN